MNPLILTSIIVIGVILLALIILVIVFGLPQLNKGKRGEHETAHYLEKLVGSSGYVINDVIIQGLGGKNSQVDHIVICTRGVFVIETKNYAGIIIGKDKDQRWLQLLDNGDRKYFYSPVKQNMTHLVRVKQKLHILDDKKVFSYIIFVNGDIRRVRAKNVGTLEAFKKRFLAINHHVLSNDEVEKYNNVLQEAKDNPVQSNQEHIAEIKKARENIQNSICPLCGSPLVMHRGRNGRYYVCSNEKCKFNKREDNQPNKRRDERHKSVNQTTAVAGNAPSKKTLPQNKKQVVTPPVKPTVAKQPVNRKPQPTKKTKVTPPTAKTQPVTNNNQTPKKPQKGPQSTADNQNHGQQSKTKGPQKKTEKPIVNKPNQGQKTKPTEINKQPQSKPQGGKSVAPVQSSTGETAPQSKPKHYYYRRKKKAKNNQGSTPTTSGTSKEGS